MDDVKDQADKDIELKKLQKKYDKVYDKWNILNKQVLDLEDKQVYRETPKKLEVDTKTTMSLEDMNKIRRELYQEEVVDAEYEEKDNEDT